MPLLCCSEVLWCSPSYSIGTRSAGYCRSGSPSHSPSESKTGMLTSGRGNPPSMRIMRSRDSRGESTRVSRWARTARARRTPRRPPAVSIAASRSRSVTRPGRMITSPRTMRSTGSRHAARSSQSRGRGVSNRPLYVSTEAFSAPRWARTPATRGGVRPGTVTWISADLGAGSPRSSSAVWWLIIEPSGIASSAAAHLDASVFGAAASTNTPRCTRRTAGPSSRPRVIPAARAASVSNARPVSSSGSG